MGESGATMKLDGEAEPVGAGSAVGAPRRRERPSTPRVVRLATAAQDPEGSPPPSGGVVDSGAIRDQRLEESAQGRVFLIRESKDLIGLESRRVASRSRKRLKGEPVASYEAVELGAGGGESAISTTGGQVSVDRARGAAAEGPARSHEGTLDR